MQQSYRSLFNSLLLHFRPRTVPERTLRLTLTWGLGGMAVVLIFLLFATGLLLKFVYEPFPDRAYESILYLQDSVVLAVNHALTVKAPLLILTLLVVLLAGVLILVVLQTHLRSLNLFFPPADDRPLAEAVGLLANNCRVTGLPLIYKKLLKVLPET